MNRSLYPYLEADLSKKMVFLTGPRQSGKTTLSQSLLVDQPSGQYLNYDVAEDRAVIERGTWSRRAPLLVFDEIHKMPTWKS